ncbi:hypothetical protein WJX72_005594 [[Myrmecia] bisecta]|uniref:CAAX prenyl protease 2/Lysostaphin resistance protein A-like domain-containing protein n=1 Tax=[Myrmecia] bisecta TaxID=41462 RepID=A0AAW1R6V1_9CHLO
MDPGEQAPIDTSTSPEEQPRFIQVPWDLNKVFQVMILWVLAFWILGYWIIPLGLGTFGLEREDLTTRGQALVHLLLDVSEMGVTLGLLWACLRRYKPLALGWFRSWLRPARRWVPQVLLALLSFPLVDIVSARSQIWFRHDQDIWGPLEQSLSAGDPVTNALYFVVVTVCAPIWEEAIFRGFLLPSLTKYMRVPVAIVASAMVFAFAHFSLQRFLPLVLLGIIFGTLFVRTKNLLSSVLLHSFWNMWIFYCLAMRGGM